MKHLRILLLAAALIGPAAFAEQKLVLVPVADGKPDTRALEDILKTGWHVVVASVVTDSDSFTLSGKPKQAYTTVVIYILDREEPLPVAPRGMITPTTIMPFESQQIPASAVQAR